MSDLDLNFKEIKQKISTKYFF